MAARKVRDEQQGESDPNTGPVEITASGDTLTTLELSNNSHSGSSNNHGISGGFVPTSPESDRVDDGETDAEDLPEVTAEGGRDAVDRSGLGVANAHSGGDSPTSGEGVWLKTNPPQVEYLETVAGFENSPRVEKKNPPHVEKKNPPQHFSTHGGKGLTLVVDNTVEKKMPPFSPRVEKISPLESTPAEYKWMLEWRGTSRHRVAIVRRRYKRVPGKRGMVWIKDTGDGATDYLNHIDRITLERCEQRGKVAIEKLIETLIRDKDRQTGTDSVSSVRA